MDSMKLSDSGVVPTTNRRLGTVGTVVPNQTIVGTSSEPVKQVHTDANSGREFRVPSVPTVPTNLERKAETNEGTIGELERRVTQLLTEFQRDYGSIPDLREKVCAIVKRCLPKRTGRPRLDEVTLAIRMREHGMAWSTIYPCVIPYYEELDAELRALKQRQLRDRVRNRQYACRRRLSKQSRRSASRF